MKNLTCPGKVLPFLEPPAARVWEEKGEPPSELLAHGQMCCSAALILKFKERPQAQSSVHSRNETSLSSLITKTGICSFSAHISQAESASDERKGEQDQGSWDSVLVGLRARGTLVGLSSASLREGEVFPDAITSEYTERYLKFLSFFSPPFTSTFSFLKVTKISVVCSVLDFFDLEIQGYPEEPGNSAVFG